MVKKWLLLSFILLLALPLYAQKQVEKKEILKNGSFIIKTYDEKGVLLRETPYKNEVKQGIEKEYLNSKLVAEWPYDDGNLNGLARIYYGSYTEERPYRDKKAEGVSKISINGKEIAEMTYKDNKTYGFAKFYGEGKFLPYSVFCREGVYVSGECEGGRRLSTKEAEGRCENIYLFVINPPNCER